MARKSKLDQRLRRKARVRKRVSGTVERPRLSIFRSASHIYAQVINDESGTTLASVHSYAKGNAPRASVERCSALGKELASQCKTKNIVKVVFDKNGYAYHGRVKAFADGAREGGLEF